MVRNTLKLTKFGGLAVAAFALLSPTFNIINTYAAETDGCQTDLNTKVVTCQEKRDFQVEVQEILEVTVTPPDDGWASGDTSQCLTNEVGLSVSSNNYYGFKATMTSASSQTALVNKSDSTKTIATGLISNDSSTFQNGIWGYAISKNAQYNPIKAKNDTPGELFENDKAGAKAGNIFFKACAGNDTVAGTYSQTMLISVVAGVHDKPASSPTYPEQPGVEEPDRVIGSTGGSTSSNRYNYGTAATPEEEPAVVDRDTTNSSSYNGYAYPQGEMNTTATINEGTPLATGLAITAAIAAIFGIFFFILLFKRRKDEDEEEQQY